MKRPLRPEEAHLWRAVASTVAPFAGRKLPDAPTDKAARTAKLPPPGAAPARPHAPAPVALRKPSAALHGIEPNRERRISVGREEIGGRLDLHGMDQDQARAALQAFVLRAVQEGHRAVLIITGRGKTGSGVLRRRAPDWLAEHPLRSVVAGVARAHRRHGGEGALYVALKRRG